MADDIPELGRTAVLDDGVGGRLAVASQPFVDCATLDVPALQGGSSAAAVHAGEHRADDAATGDPVPAKTSGMCAAVGVPVRSKKSTSTNRGRGLQPIAQVAHREAAPGRGYPPRETQHPEAFPHRGR